MEELVVSGHPVKSEDIKFAIRLIAENKTINLKSIFSERITVSPKKGFITPKSSTQREFIQSVKQADIVLAIGPAGTGKTYLAVALAVALALAVVEVEVAVAVAIAVALMLVVVIVMMKLVLMFMMMIMMLLLMMIMIMLSIRLIIGRKRADISVKAFVDFSMPVTQMMRRAMEMVRARTAASASASAEERGSMARS